ncbi:MAG: IS66 family transposase, partial [bacterium]|nr:IS66 family transposase [bacterium]
MPMPTSPTIAEIKRLKCALDDAQTTIAARDEVIAQRDEAITVRDETIAELARDLRLTKRELAYLRSKPFRPSSETLPTGPTLFEQLGLAAQDLAPDDEGSTLSAREEKQRKKRARRPRGRKPLPEHLPREQVEIALRDEERCCDACGKQRVKIGEDTSETLERVPAHYVVRVTVRGRYACRCGEGGVRSPPAPPRPIPASYAGASLIAHVLVGKFADHLPLYRQAQIFGRDGLDLGRSTLTDWVGGAAKLLERLVQVVRDEVLAHTYLQADETPVKMQTKKGAKVRTKDGYFFCYRAPESDQLFYDFRAGRSRDGPSTVLAQYSGTLQVDGYTGYREVIDARGLGAVACLAHIRRKFHEAYDTAPREATLVLLLIRRLYRVEKRGRRLSPDKLQILRERRSRPVFERLGRLL